MITHDAKNGFNDMLKNCLSESLKTESHAKWSIKTLSDLNAIKEKEIYVLTISSYFFRVVLVLHFTNNAKTKSYVANALKVAPENMEQNRYYDFLGEIGNAFCGVYKRELGHYFPHLGMSTPNLLVSDTIQHLQEWSHEHEGFFEAKADDDTKFSASIFVSSYADVNFKYSSKSIDEDVETGALEFF